MMKKIEGKLHLQLQYRLQAPQHTDHKSCLSKRPKAPREIESSWGGAMNNRGENKGCVPSGRDCFARHLGGKGIIPGRHQKDQTASVQIEEVFTAKGKMSQLGITKDRGTDGTVQIISVLFGFPNEKLKQTLPVTNNDSSSASPARHHHQPQLSPPPTTSSSSAAAAASSATITT